MNSKKLGTLFIAVISLLVFSQSAFSIPLEMSKEQLIRYTSEWKGERFPDGRPKVPDDVIERMKLVNIEEAWGVLRSEGYDYQFERGWKMVHPGKVLCGRALTVTYMPLRTVANRVTNEIGKEDGRIGNQISWPIDMLSQGDVYVADIYKREIGGPIIGGNLANSIFAKSGNGVLFNGEVRDLAQLEAIEGFNAFVRDWNPGVYRASMIMGINIPTNIGNVAVFPGDVILGNREGVIVIPPHLAEKVVKTAEFIRLKDEFGFERLKAGVYTPGQIDTGDWSDDIEKDFSQWMRDNIDNLSVPKAQVQEILKERTL
ncbi:MAG: RraA family protein [Verrucomicrobia bacterium]|nr:RraA family protein [Verrucomicrobiota bacterium]MDA1068185.1 RraA family protein [Verrucomicrobiota bacterium]